ncbi:MAG: homocysteine S-methyltransferase family protein [Oscillospiraceae bacterium]
MMCDNSYPPDGCICLTDFLNITYIDEFSKQDIENRCEGYAKSAKSNNNNQKIGGTICYNAIEMEPFSENLFLDIIDIYKYQAKGYEKGGADFIFIKDVKSLGHLRGALLGAKVCSIPTIVSVFVDDDGELFNGTSLLSALLVAQSLGAKAFLINGQDKDIVLKVFAEILPFAKIPIFADCSLWSDNGLVSKITDPLQVVGEFSEQNTYICWKQNENSVNICCSNEKIHKSEISCDYAVALSSAREPFLFDEMYEVSAPYSSEEFFPDDFLEIEDLDFDIIQIHLTTKQYAYHIAINAYMLEKPVCFLSDDEEILETALIFYKGIALVNCQCNIPKQRLFEICQKYGAVLTKENSY